MRDKRQVQNKLAKNDNASLKVKESKDLRDLIDNLVPSHSMQKYLIILLVIMFRASLSLTPYSGEDDAPKYGDFECHRTWMEVTYNLPISQWYNDTPYSNSSYWPIDYPPLCAYTHLGMASIISLFQPQAIQLGLSKGYDKGQYRALMGFFIMIFELLVFIPALEKVLDFYYSDKSKTTRNLYLLANLCITPIFYIDHGHFQPNSVMHGLVLWAIYYMFQSKIEKAVIFMVLAVNFKQMALYYGLPFGVYALMLLYKDSTQVSSNFLGRTGYIFGRVIILIAVFIGTFLVVYLPFFQASGLPGVQQILIRIFPVKRGLFENNVASFWCVLHNFYKVKFIYDQPAQIKIAAVATILGCIPSVIYLMRTPNNKQFLFALFNVSMSFFMFSFHVHEKQILLPLLIFGLLIHDFRHYFTFTVTVGNFSLAKLYLMDHNQISYYPITFGFFYIGKMFDSFMINNFKVPAKEINILLYDDEFQIQNDNKDQKQIWISWLILRLRNTLCSLGVLFMIGFHICKTLFPPSEKLFDLYWAINNAFSFATFALVLVYSHSLMHENKKI